MVTSNQILQLGPVVFPKFVGTARNCNMLPFIMGALESIPTKYQAYAKAIQACKIPSKEIGQVGYLSIHESWVKEGETQRRPGIHTEGHRNTGWGGGGWGGGVSHGSGIYMASNVAKSCRAWDTCIVNPQELGDCEHLRDSLKNPINMKENTLYWFTDRCPHEALPIVFHENIPQDLITILDDGNRYFKRQWFRVVTSAVDAWYEADSTPNTNGITPPESCRIIRGSKFD